MRPPTSPGTLLSRRGVAELLGITRQAVQKSEDKLPRPFDTPDGKPYWKKDAILRHRGDPDGTDS